jgi:hypothetical protein
MRNRRGWRLERNQKRRTPASGRKLFDLFITADQSIRYQQNLSGRRIPILELSTNDLRRILAASSLLHSAIETIKPNEFRQLVIP